MSVNSTAQLAKGQRSGGGPGADLASGQADDVQRAVGPLGDHR
jgi:hypothetical protein